MTRREAIVMAIFGTGYACPKWLERLFLGKHPKQIRETPRYDGSARQIIERLLQGADDVDRLVEVSSQQGSIYLKDDYFRGLHNGLLMAQAQLQDTEYHPV